MRLWPKMLIHKIMLCLFVSGFLTVGFIYLLAFLMGPPKLAGDQSTIIYDNAGAVIGEERGTHTSTWLELDDISPIVIDATIAIEDQHFFEHSGFDYRRIVAAVLKNATSLSLKEGASTLSQQYARNLFLSPEKTWSRKFKEAFYTVRLEMFYSKEEILEGYLNTIYYGHGAYGIESASFYFFNKSVMDLTVAEASMLVGIPKGPTYYSPLNNEENATERQRLILRTLLEKEILSEAEHTAALEEKLVYSITPEDPGPAPYFRDHVLQEASILLDLDPSTVRVGGYHIHTTLNSDFQQQLEADIRNTIQDGSDIETSAVSMDPYSGAVVAMVGGRDYRKSTYNRAVHAKRMSGSTFKPFLYYAALHYGYTASTQLMSKPTAFAMEDGKVYQPSNFNGYYANEPITLAQALALSDNVYAVKTNMYLGPEKLIETAEQFGLKGNFPAVPALALGTASVSVEDMTVAYGMLANNGRSISVYTVEKISDRNGKTVYEKKQDKAVQVLDPKKAFILTHLMTGMFDVEMNDYTAVTGSSIANNLTRVYAGKSGTTSSDSWMIGYSPSIVTAIWTGYDDNRPMQIVAENSYAKEIWARFMEAAHEGQAQDVFAMPSGVVGLPIDPTSGKRATPDCTQSRIMYFEKGTEPRDYCTEHEYEESEDDRGLFEKWFDVFF
ncbi:transglycosylase domain-containing protein [Oceanobacillus saliphilus]|uniref:transglycosylase domain-containing protein n=1 Tax=Oceanobacillus saliphilus TaxID=2925834 RepID=UPI00201DF7E5|nr:transglycosylase domain-containing protein [Oceanobacillus saliphilus]